MRHKTFWHGPVALKTKIIQKNNCVCESAFEMFGLAQTRQTTHFEKTGNGVEKHKQLFKPSTHTPSLAKHV